MATWFPQTRMGSLLFDWRAWKDRSAGEENWIPPSRPRILSPPLWRRVCDPHGLLPPSLSPPSLWHRPLIIPPLQTRPALRLTSRSVLFTEQCSHLIEGCQNPESGFLSISKSCKFYFKNTSPTPHFYFQCHPLLTVSCLYYISSLLSFFQALSLLSQQPILHTAAGGLIKLLI